MPDLRQRRRVMFSANAQIRSEDSEQSIVARVHNVSERGIFVTASRALRRGSAVKCRIIFGDDRRVLRGKVAWVRPPVAAQESRPAEAGAGIEFIDLSARDSDLLRRLVTPAQANSADTDTQEPTDAEKRESEAAESQTGSTPAPSMQPGENAAEIQQEIPIDVWFTGMPSSVRCKAVVSGAGLELSTRLPFLRMGSDVKVEFDHRGVRETRAGVVGAVVMVPSDEDQVPRLMVTVSTPQNGSARGVIEVPAARAGSLRPTPDFVPSTLVDEEALATPAPQTLTAVGPGPHGSARSVDIGGQAANDSLNRVGPRDQDRTQRVSWAEVERAHRARGNRGDRREREREQLEHGATTATGRVAGSRRVVRRWHIFTAVAVAVGAAMTATSLLRGPSSGSLTHSRAALPAAGRSLGAPSAAPAAAAMGASAASAPSPRPPTIPAPAPRPATPAANPAADIQVEPVAKESAPSMPFTVSVTGKRTEIFIPITGSSTHADSYPLLAPKGLAVVLPAAQPVNGTGRYAIGGGSVAQVWIERNHGGSRVRFHFTRRMLKYDFALEPRGLRLIVLGR